MTHIPEKVAFHRAIVITRKHSINILHTYPQDLLWSCELSVVVSMYAYDIQSVLENCIDF